MTACFKLMKVLQQQPRFDSEGNCTPCVYFSENLNKAEYPVLMDKQDRCGLGFRPGDDGCREMRTDNCSTRKSKT